MSFCAAPCAWTVNAEQLPMDPIMFQDCDQLTETAAVTLNQTQTLGLTMELDATVNIWQGTTKDTILLVLRISESTLDVRIQLQMCC